MYLFALIATTGLTLSLGFATDITRLDLPFAIFFAPMGAMIRWGVSKVFNKPEVIFIIFLFLFFFFFSFFERLSLVFLFFILFFFLLLI